MNKKLLRKTLVALVFYSTSNPLFACYKVLECENTKNLDGWTIDPDDYGISKDKMFCHKAGLLNCKQSDSALTQDEGDAACAASASKNNESRGNYTMTGSYCTIWPVGAKKR
ncbi:hypothetical protein Bealeia1_01444 [Candidatus Bealeia paramacronuclearis]|uniref:DUF3012 domain-containing protein n=1 Tax=Candidatus Bealeia paramacronuclearis TaxID=1921001 RepID=A0ABZ2C6P4_9PROT|nr:hypothetical protein [Candidatus Bealeia paramacronuclearis]